MQQQSNLMLAIGHLNAPVASGIRVDQLANALRLGTTRSASRLAAALIHSVFNEITPNLILQCAAEAGADVRCVNHLYREALADDFPPAPLWENAVRPLL